MHDHMRNEDSLDELSVDECRRLLGQRQIGRLALVDHSGPVIFPVTYVWTGREIVFRTAAGSKLDAARDHERVAFEIDAVDESSRTGWSVLCRGKAAPVVEQATLERLRFLGLTPWAPGDRRHYVRILPTAITGRRITLPTEMAPHWLG
jgi:nitroimidazol reductase NimA-like FMN-containing flavoprotein (pyridoxamine 5'-phosphate oxidase superfamily)